MIIWDSKSDDNWSRSSVRKRSWEGLHVWWKCIHSRLFLPRLSLSGWPSRNLSDWLEPIYHRRWSWLSIPSQNRSNWPLNSNLQTRTHHLPCRLRHPWRWPGLLTHHHWWRNLKTRRIHFRPCREQAQNPNLDAPFRRFPPPDPRDYIELNPEPETKIVN